MISEKLRTKLAERAAHSFAASLKGTKHFKILKKDESVFANHQKAILEFCRIDSKPTFSWRLPINDENVLEFLCSRFEIIGGHFYIPFETPFIVEVYVSDLPQLLKSMWNLENTRDITLFTQNPAKVFQLQDLEYQLAYFELDIAPPQTNDH